VEESSGREGSTGGGRGRMRRQPEVGLLGGRRRT
jgi:hypothetical protein